MRVVSLLTGVVLLVGSTLTLGVAGGCGNDGSPENWAGSCETDANEVRCGEEARTPVAVFTMGTIGVEACNDGSIIPLQGRVGADDGCFCVYADGDADNPGQLQGWVRIDRSGARVCSDTGSQPSYNSGNC